MDASGKSPCPGKEPNTYISSSNPSDTSLSPLACEVDWLEVCEFLAPPKPRGDSLWDDLFGPDHKFSILVAPRLRLVLPSTVQFRYPDPTFQWTTLAAISVDYFLDLCCRETEKKIASRYNANTQSGPDVDVKDVDLRYRRELQALATRSPEVVHLRKWERRYETLVPFVVK